MRPLGWHWMAQAEGCRAAWLDDPERVRAYLADLALRLELTAVGAPSVERLGPGRVAGVVLLAQSHASVHTQVDGDRLFADLFSCSPFEPTLAAEVLRDWFAPTHLQTSTVERGSAP